MSSSTLRKRTTAASKEKEAEVILDTTEQEEIVHSLIQQAETARDFWLPLVGALCLAACSVPFVLPAPERLPIIILRLLTIPSLFLTGLSLVRPALILIPPEVLSLDYLILAPLLAAGLVVYLNGDIISQRTWGWTIPAAVLGLASEVKGSLRGGVEQARKMQGFMYSAPTA